MLHPRNWSELDGSRLAFAQGGRGGVRLVMLTPPIKVVPHPSGSVELLWTPRTMPFRFEDAPLLVENFGKGDAPRLAATLRNVKRTTVCGSFGSRFRSRSTPLADDVAEEIENLAKLNRARARSYQDALPYPPRVLDSDREKTYLEFLKLAASPISNNTRCS